MHRTLRLFVALCPPEPLGAALTALRPTGVAIPEHRVVDASTPYALHMTLAFVGETHHKELRSVKESVQRSASGLGAFTITAQRLVTIPTPQDGGPPRQLAVTTDAPATLLEMHRRLSQRLTSPKRNGRRARFLPHITTLRYLHNQTSAAVDEPVMLDAGWGPGAWRVAELLLFSSVLTREGSVYQVEHSVPLKE